MECTHRFPLFGRFEWVLGLFWLKNGCFWPLAAVFETEVRHLRHRFPAATVEFLAQTLCGYPSHP